MKRREFIKIIAATSVAASIPGKLFAGTPSGVADAIRWFEQHFECAMGAPWAFAEPRPESYADCVDDPSWWQEDDERKYDGLTPYNTYSIVAPNEPVAIRALLKLFGDAIRNHPSIAGAPLYWRLEDKIKVKSVSRRVGGDLVATQEQLEDGYPNFWQVCEEQEGVERSDEDGCFYKNRRTETFVTVRTRIAVPELQRLGEQGLNMHDGWTLKLTGTEDL